MRGSVGIRYEELAFQTIQSNYHVVVYSFGTFSVAGQRSNSFLQLLAKMLGPNPGRCRREIDPIEDMQLC
jgi:hypothetical protein